MINIKISDDKQREENLISKIDKRFTFYYKGCLSSHILLIHDFILWYRALSNFFT